MADDFEVASTDDGAREAGRIGDQFLASLHHDIRTPLSGILGMVDLLQETELDEEQKEYISTTRLCADQLMEMLNSALEYSALSAGNISIEKSEFHLPQMLEETVQEFAGKAREKGLSLLCELDLGLPSYVVGDAVRLRQAFHPLLVNAVKFTASGSVRVRGSWNGTGENNHTLTLSVEDTGIGIDQDKLDAIFKSFHQLENGLSRSYAGMGLGLAVARRLASLLGGQIDVESKRGLGSTFRLIVPLDLPPAAEVHQGPLAGDTEENTAVPQVLFVDDNDVARRVVSHMVKRAGYSIDCAVGGVEGIEAARSKQYALILMDLQMPGVNGIEATRSIRALPGYETVPVLALSANYSEEFVRSCKQAGLRGFLSKPIQRSELLRTLEAFLK